MTPTDAATVIGLIAATLGFLTAALALAALLNHAFTHAWNTTLTAAERHIDTCITQALQIPLHPNLEDEHRALIEEHRD